MAEKMDRRKARTKQQLQRALLALLTEKGADTITVTEVAERADVNRGTFYLHYKDVADMLQQMKDEVLQHLSACVEQLDLTEAMLFADKEEPYPPMMRVFEKIAEHSEFLRLMLGPGGDLSFAIRLRELMTKRMYHNLEISAPEKHLIPLDFWAAYQTSANFGVILHWIEGGMALPPEQMAKIMIRAINYGPLVTIGIRQAPKG
ncbi:TetR/AcrR family transcriptional regulator [Paenibacillus pasadenensis]|uniref:TetR/AcrR family transcriptional regulator n=1 Tax=Paenibacillus pasadenensis TaxID=217090 RepID=UPI00204058F4|nr:TetR/AcrR family transcriptional regulator [Paenibacillus pasadenensis]MCM3749926.1 TetR/AcrR family transcriptional regulator [Paenibacillus pasadenensis]